MSEHDRDVIANPVGNDAGVTITPYRDGPYLVRGPFALVDQAGEAIPGARRTVALCRCGKSRIRPYCDGTHKLVAFEAPGVLETWPREEMAGDGVAD